MAGSSVKHAIGFASVCLPVCLSFSPCLVFSLCRYDGETTLWVENVPAEATAEMVEVWIKAGISNFLPNIREARRKLKTMRRRLEIAQDHVVAITAQEPTNTREKDAKKALLEGLERIIHRHKDDVEKADRHLNIVLERLSTEKVWFEHNEREIESHAAREAQSVKYQEIRKSERGVCNKHRAVLRK